MHRNMSTNRKTASRGVSPEVRIRLFDQAEISTVFRFLRQPNRPDALRLVAKRGSPEVMELPRQNPAKHSG